MLANSITNKYYRQFNKYKQQILLILVLYLSILILNATSPFFLKWDNIRNILDQSTINIIVGIGMTFVICTGGIDLSVGSIAALSGVIMALLMKADISVFVSVITAILISSFCGSLNGLIITVFRINPFIVTLALMSVLRGITLILTKAIPIYSFPQSFTWFGSGSLLSLPFPVIIALFSAIIGYFALANTKLGYYILALGGNEEALRRSGVNINLYKIIVYTICALTAALAGLVFTARLNSADPLAGYMLELDAIATVILGGTSVKGGQGSIFGTVIAGLFLAVLRNGLTIHGIASYYQQLLVGLIILVAVIISEKRVRI